MFAYPRTPVGVLAGLLTATGVVWLDSLMRQAVNAWQWIVSLAFS
jgi:hypothetical protein